MSKEMRKLRIKIMQKFKHDNPKIAKKRLAKKLVISQQQLYSDEQYLLKHPKLILGKEILRMPFEKFKDKINKESIVSSLREEKVMVIEGKPSSSGIEVRKTNTGVALRCRCGMQKFHIRDEYIDHLFSAIEILKDKKA